MAAPDHPEVVVSGPDTIGELRCDEFQEAVAVYALVNSMFLLASFALCLVLICRGRRVVSRRPARLLATWGAMLVVGGLFLAATWPRRPDVAGCDGAASEADLAYTYLTILSGLIWFFRGRRLATEDIALPDGALDDDIAIAEEAALAPRPCVDLDDGETALLDDDGGGDGAAFGAAFGAATSCELATCCVVLADDDDRVKAASSSS